MQEPDTLPVEDLKTEEIENAINSKHRVAVITAPYDPPELDFTPEELDDFIAKMVFGESWTEHFVREKVEIVLRTRSRKESEFNNAVIDSETRARIITSQSQLASRLNELNIITSLVEFRGKPMQQWTVPARPWTEDHFRAFAAFIEEHPMSDIPEPLHFVLLAVLVQFQDKCYRMQKQVIEESEMPGFSRPGGGF